MKSITASEVRAWVRDELLDPKRTRPVVAITTNLSLGRFFVDPGYLQAQLGELADVVTLETGDATWELAEALPARLDVYGGAMRVWWPGLTPASNPSNHKLYFVHSEDEGRAQVTKLRNELRRKLGLDGPRRVTPAAVPEPSTPVETELVTVSVLSIEDGVLLQESDGSLGRLVSADVPVEALEVCLREDMQLSVTRPKEHDWAYGEAPCSAKGSLPYPWECIGAELEVGNIVQGRVARIFDLDKFALIELLPTATGIVFKDEVDPTFVEQISDILEVDELVHVKILELDPEGQRAKLSVKAALVSQTPPRALPSLVPGGAAFDWTAFLSRTGVEFQTKLDPRDERIQELEGELEASNGDRSVLRQTITTLRGEKHSLQSRYQDLERRASADLDPMSDERAFLRGVRVWYAREIGEGERYAHPLQPMRVGRHFLESAASLDGISVEKILEVAGQVACGRAKDIAAREVHPLGINGPATVTGQTLRAKDGAKAWRCSLQTKTASARRLHWWQIPGPHGGTIEFASVAVHDFFDIPE